MNNDFWRRSLNRRMNERRIGLHNLINKARVKQFIFHTLFCWKRFIFWHRFSFNLSFNSALFFINLPLFSFNVFEHVFILRESNVVREDFRILPIKLKDFRKSRLCLRELVASFEKFRNIVKNQVILEDTYNMSVLVVNHIIHYFDVVEIFWCHILRKILL